MNARPMGENQVLLVPTPGLCPKDFYLEEEDDDDRDAEHDNA